MIGIVMFVAFGIKTYDATVAEDSNKFLGYFLFTIAGLLLISVIFVLILSLVWAALLRFNDYWFTTMKYI